MAETVGAVTSRVTCLLADCSAANWKVAARAMPDRLIKKWPKFGQFYPKYSNDGLPKLKWLQHSGNLWKIKSNLCCKGVIEICGKGCQKFFKRN